MIKFLYTIASVFFIVAVVSLISFVNSLLLEEELIFMPFFGHLLEVLFFGFLTLICLFLIRRTKKKRRLTTTYKNNA
ncbi:hypothetical protein APR42_12735 [Salegentibacter mishustinae]|uniref:Uncharacterized protein n=1 Tax=Salegentibacter mishustinae TaxID=270918 RepID=A0A0Q9Z2S0_9FLAO|nr:hypothetical protein APR42_12735 [Salegentibacter mishustinae]PNW19563.1 hypothetical protein APB85_16855 [Salegentibacter mishustinae]